MRIDPLPRSITRQVIHCFRLGVKPSSSPLGMHNREMISRTRLPGHYDRRYDKSCPSVNRSIDEPADQPIHLSRTRANMYMYIYARTHACNIVRRRK